MSSSRGAGAQASPDLPSLIAALPEPGSGPGASTRAPQTEFDRARQVIFLENLSVTGSVRSAAAAAQVSHQTAYRARRACAAFRTAWEGALVVARANAADTLACRAIDGIEEKVFYHGEVVATRTRYSDRLLLAHLARLDRLAETPEAAGFAESWDEAIAAFERGENFSPGPCNTRSKSYMARPSVTAAPDVEYEHWDDRGVDWDDKEAADAEIDRIVAAMEASRPADAPCLTGEGSLLGDSEVEQAQFAAFLHGIPYWWLVIPPIPSEEGMRWQLYGAREVQEAVQGLEERHEPEPEQEPRAAAGEEPAGPGAQAAAPPPSDEPDPAAT